MNHWIVYGLHVGITVQGFFLSSGEEEFYNFPLKQCVTRVLKQKVVVTQEYFVLRRRVHQELHALIYKEL